MLDLLYPATSFVTAILFSWSGLRAWQSKNRFLKWGGAGLSAVLSAATALISIVLIIGSLKLHGRNAPTPIMHVEGTPAQVRRGQAVSDSFCAACHTKTGMLTGGVDIGEHFPINIGSLVSANLTPAGDLRHWSDGDIFRAIRNAVDPEGHWLFVMSLTNASHLSDDDTRAVIAYLRSLPAAGAPTPNPPDRISGLGLFLLGAGVLPTGKPVTNAMVTAPPPAPTAHYGEYILSYQDCRECHGKDLSGGVPGQLPPLGPDLHIIKDWTFEQFRTALRTGVDPDGHELGKQMPWQPIGRMSDDELRAIFEYLSQLPKS